YFSPSWGDEKDEKREPYFLTLLKNETDMVATHCLQHNKVLLVELLQRKYMSELLAGSLDKNRKFYDRLAELCLHHVLTTTDLPPLPDAFKNYYAARCVLSSRIPAISYEEFLPLFEKTSVFNALFKMDPKKVDVRILFHIVECILKSPHLRPHGPLA